MRHVLFVAVLLTSCAAEPLLPLTDYGPPLPPEDVKDAEPSAVQPQVADLDKDAFLPPSILPDDPDFELDAESPADTSLDAEVELDPDLWIEEERCDDLDNDLDGKTDEGVLNSCGVCGLTPEEVPNAVDDDCDGHVDEGQLNARCRYDIECEEPLGCLNGRCEMACPSECDRCNSCLADWYIHDGAPLLWVPACEVFCDICAVGCQELGGVCFQGQCVRDAVRARCLPEYDTQPIRIDTFVEGEELPEDVHQEFLTICVPEE